MAADPDGLDRKQWAQQPGEGAKAFHAFTHFLAMLPHERSMGGAYTNHQKLCKHSPNADHPLHADPNWQGWRFKYSWVERAQAHDAEMAEVDRLHRVHEITKMNQRHTAIAVALQNIVVERLNVAAQTGEPFKMTPSQMASLLDKATLVERRSRGEATSIIKHEGGPEATAALNLSLLTDEELVVFQALVAKATPTPVTVE